MEHVVSANRSLYCASKWELESKNKCVAIRLASHRIRSNIIARPFINTPVTIPSFYGAAFMSSMLTKIKFGRIGTVGDLTGAGLYLASEASALVTGTSLVVDRGWTAS